MDGTVTMSINEYDSLIKDRENFKKILKEKTIIRHPNKIDYMLYTSDDVLSQLGKENDKLKYDNQELREKITNINETIRAIETIRAKEITAYDRASESYNDEIAKFSKMNFFQFYKWRKKYRLTKQYNRKFN